MKTPYPVLFILILSIVFVGCNPSNQAIKKDLNSRFTKFEIVEIRIDTSNVYDAKMSLLSLKINISDVNLNIAKATNYYYDKQWSYDKTSHYMDSISTNLSKRYMDFMSLISSKSEPCYYVKYRIYKDELKVEKEEFYYFRKNDGVITELLHRPCDWSDFLKEEECTDLSDQCYAGYKGFLDGIINNTF